MRERILSALRQVAAGTAPTSAHQTVTFQYAQQALEQDQALGWHLLQNGNRLRIMTIDALCQMLAHAIPLHSNHYAQIATQPQVIYYQAARNYVQMACQSPDHQAEPDYRRSSRCVSQYFVDLNSNFTQKFRSSYWIKARSLRRSDVQST